MLVISRSLKAMVLIVGVLVVGLGIYGAFQIHNADADTPDACSQYRHKDAGNALVYDYVHHQSHHNVWSATIRCGFCGGPTRVTWVDYKVYAVLINRVQHNGPSGWAYCHGHGLSYEYIGIQRVLGVVNCAYPDSCGG